MFLHLIPGLSERYLYINDDVMVVRPVREDMFFTEPGVPIMRSASPWYQCAHNALYPMLLLPVKSCHPLLSFSYAVHNSLRDANSDGACLPFHSQHVPYAATKTLLTEFTAHVENLPSHLAARTNRFRCNSDFATMSTMLNMVGAFYDRVPLRHLDTTVIWTPGNR